MSVIYGQTGPTFAEHVQKCEHGEHSRYVFGVYDEHTQCVVVGRVTVCGPESARPLADQLGRHLDALATVWVYGWSNPNVEPPARIKSGHCEPPPDAIVSGLDSTPAGNVWD